MATKILFNGNRIIFDGHADTAEECRAITAMCDSLAANENFKTIVYESGHAVFEQVSGGESEMFAMNDYVLTSRYNSETGYSAAELAAKGTIKKRVDDLEEFVADFENNILPELEAQVAALEAILPATAEVGQYLKVSAVDEDGKISAVETVSVSEYKLPLTASELVVKLSKIE